MIYIAEFGCLSLVFAFIASLCLVFVPGIGIFAGQERLMRLSRTLCFIIFGFMVLAQILLTLCFLTDDFSVRYVAANSSTVLPWFYKLCAVWGGHEGSILLWVVILSIWMMLIAVGSQPLPIQFVSRVLVVMGLLAAGLLAFILFTSNPFIRLLEIIPTQGRDLNPLLQDPGFLFHPPMLYMGYVGLSVAFAFAIAALWIGRVESAWAKWTRPWTLAAWCCLTAGITLGSWWAYRELGWGGWWFWDPVENASFMPWLVATALIHSLIACEKRNQFKAWTVLLAIMAFSLSLIGTFLVRSGVLTSVHAFAVDPQRGLYILCFLLLVIGGSLTLFAWRGDGLSNPEKPNPMSREGVILLNNIFLTVAMLSVLLGTLYPLIIDGLSLGKISVGAPYFNTVFIPLMIPLFLLMGIGTHMKWRQDQWRRLLPSWLKSAAIILIFSIGGLSATGHTLAIQPLIGLSLALWIIISIATSWLQRWQNQGVKGFKASFLAMHLAHLGVAVSIIGVAISSGYGITKDVSMAPGQSLEVNGYQVRFVDERQLNGANYGGVVARFTIKNIENKTHATTIYPEKRIYRVGNMAMTDAAIDVTPFRDIYVALGEPLDDHAWSVRVYYKPMIRWIWAGGFIILLGGLIALANPRYYQKRYRQTTEVISEA